MNKNLEKIIDLSDKLLSFKIKRHSVKEKFQSKITMGYGGGIFRLDQNFISYLKTLLDLGKTDQVILLDINENPIVIDNLKTFFKDVVDRYFSALGEYQANCQLIKESKPQIWDVNNVDKE